MGRKKKEKKEKEPEVKKIVRRRLVGKFTRKENGRRVVYGPGDLVEFDPYNDLPEAFDGASWEVVSGKKFALSEVLSDVADPILEDFEREEAPEEEAEDVYKNLLILHKGNGLYDVVNRVTQKRLNSVMLTKDEAQDLLDTYLEDE